jgi:hypothetical protein
MDRNMMPTPFVSRDHRDGPGFLLVGSLPARGKVFWVLDFVVDREPNFRVMTDDLTHLARSTTVAVTTAGAVTGIIPHARSAGVPRPMRKFASLKQALLLGVSPSIQPIMWSKEVLSRKGMMPLPRTRHNVELVGYVVRVLRGRRSEDVLEVELGYEREDYGQGPTARLRLPLHAGMRLAYGAKLFARYRGRLGEVSGITPLFVGTRIRNGRVECVDLCSAGWCGQSALRLRDIPLVSDPRTRRDHALGKWVVSAGRRRAPGVVDTES